MQHSAAGFPYAHAEVILRATSAATGARIPITVETAAAPGALELWSGAASALRGKLPAASLFFAIQSSSADFILSARISVVNGTAVGRGGRRGGRGRRRCR